MITITTNHLLTKFCILLLAADNLFGGNVSFQLQSIWIPDSGKIESEFYGDINNDTYIDRFAFINKDNSIKLVTYLNNPSNTFSSVSIPSIQKIGTYSINLIGDINNDGFNDIINYQADESTFYLLKNNSGLQFSSFKINPTWEPINAFKLYDFNHDGYLDLIVQKLSPVALIIYENDHANSFKAPVILFDMKYDSKYLSNYNIADIDLDGNDEVVSYADVINSHVNITVHKKNNDNTWNSFSYTMSDEFSLGGVDIVNIKGDKRLEVLLGGSGDTPIYSLTFDSSYNFTEEKIHITPESFHGPETRALYGYDVDLDGDIDFIVKFASPCTIEWLENTGSNTFIRHTIADNCDIFTPFDMDSDGDIDIIHRTYGSVVNLWKNNSAPHFKSDSGHILTGSLNALNWSPGIQKRPLNLDYSLDNGIIWNPIAKTISDNGEYQWNVPSNLSGKGLIRISYKQVNISHTRTATFISGYAVLETPVSGTILNSGSNTSITWKSIGNVPAVDLYYFLLKDSVMKPIIKNFQNSNSYTWTISDSISGSAKILIIVSGDPNTVTESEGVYFIGEKRSLKLLKPTGSETYFNGNLLSVAWSSSGNIDSLKISISLDSGKTWSIITNQTPNDGAYVFPLNINCKSEQCLIKIVDTRDSSIFDISAIPFKINTTSSVNVDKLNAAGSIIFGNLNTRNRYIEIIVPEAQEINFRIFSISGKLLNSETIRFSSSGRYSIPINKVLTEGVIICKIKNEKTFITKRFVL
jgi:hypothetical protein